MKVTYQQLAVVDLYHHYLLKSEGFNDKHVKMTHTYLLILNDHKKFAEEFEKMVRSSYDYIGHLELEDVTGPIQITGGYDHGHGCEHCGR